MTDTPRAPEATSGEHEHQKWCQFPFCVKCGMSRTYHEEGPMVSHGFVQAACACGAASPGAAPSGEGEDTNARLMIQGKDVEYWYGYAQESQSSVYELMRGYAALQAEVASLTAQLAERDQTIARLTQKG